MDRMYDDLQEYRARLKMAKEDGRVDVYREIADLGIPEANFIILEGLADSSARVRSLVAEILLEIADEGIIENLIERLRDETPGIRSQVMIILTKLCMTALNQLEAALNDADPDIRIFVANILGNAGLIEALPALKKALTDVEENVRYAAVEAMGKIGATEAIPLLLDILGDEWARYPAVESLGLLGAGEAVPYLREIFEADEWVRHVVIEALGNIGDSGQIDFLLQQLTSDNEMILQAAFTALAKIEQKQPSGVLVRVQEMGIDAEEIITSSLMTHEPDVKISAIWSLGLIGQERHLSLLLEQLSEPDEDVREAARRALVSFGSRQIDAILLPYPKQEPEVQKMLLDILGEIGDKRAISLVSEALQRGNDAMREVAAKTLAVFKDRSVVDLLIPHLNDPHSNVRSACAYTLGTLRAVKATRYLMPLLEDTYQDVREAASEALGRIGTGEVARHAAPLLKHPRMEVRQAAVQCLGLIMGRRVDNYLMDALGNADRGVRRFSANMLGKRKVTPALKPLTVALLDEDWQVRKSAVSALGSLGEPSSVDPLIDSLRDENLWVRYSAAIALGRSGQDKARRHLRRCLKEDVGPVKIAAIGALQCLKEPDLISLLDYLSNDPDEEVRKVVAETLAAYRTVAESYRILEIMKQDPHPKVRQAARQAFE
ncbi:MAG: HEAT repeat domain-containing protein [Deltaproteobacteria bacterium]|nr:HEAT repeat domain-containing protein [Deltaproteobacteria bacterium]